MKHQRENHFFKRISVAILVSLLAALPVRAQTANLSGQVIDQTGAIVPDVEITAMNTSTGLLRQATTDESGYFIFPLLPPGSYTLTAEMPGFAVVTVNDIALRVSINTTIQIVLKPGAIVESIDVHAAQTLTASDNRIDITNATQKYSITNEQVMMLPILTTTLGRNTLEVLPFLVPGVSPTTLFSTTQAEVNRYGRQMSINGARISSNSFSLDGGDNNDPEFNQAAAPLPNPDALSELTVITNNYQADEGRATGGVLNAVAKSGTNKLRGNARAFAINEALNSRSFFDSKRPLNRMNTFGAQVGGPLSLGPLFNGKNHSFFFFDYEGTRAKRETLSTQVVPTALEREGDFSFAPTGSRPRDPLTGKFFPGGIIPADRIDPIARFYLDRYIPLPNEGDRLLRRLLPIRFDNDQTTARIDHNLDARTTINATYFFILSDISDGAPSFPVGAATTTHAKNHNFVLRATRIISPRTVNQMTGTVTRYIYNSLLDAPGATGLHPSEAGFTGIHPQTIKFLGVPSVEIAGTDTKVVTGGGSTTAKTVWQIKDDLSHTQAEHQFKLGVEARGYLQNTAVGNNNGRIIFSNNFFGSTNPIVDFLLGVPAAYTQTSGSTRYPRQRAYYFYGMDDWRARPNLTISAGLRYELAPNAVDKLDQVSVFRPGERSLRFPNAPEGILFVGDPDPILGMVPRAGYPSDKNNLAPRIGVAYSPGSGKTAIRAGRGIFYDPTHGYNLSQQASTQPFSITHSLTNFLIHGAGGSFANPFGTLVNPFPIDMNRAIFTSAPLLQPIDPTFRTSYVYHYNLSVQRELPWRMLIETAYVGNNSFKLDRERELNVALVLPGANPSTVQSRRLYPLLGRIPSQESSGRGRFDSFHLRLARRYSRGLSFDLSYVYGKSLDDVADPFSVGFSYPLRWARSSFDRRQSFVASYTYSIPDTDRGGIVGTILDGWQVGGITQFYSGTPIDITQFEDSTLTGRVANGQGSPDFAGEFIRFDPRDYRTIVINGVAQSGNFFFDPTSFREVSVRDHREARAGTLGRNLFDGPGINLWSLAINKRFRLTESQQISLRSDIRNLFNRANFLVQPTSLIVGRNSPLGQALASGPGRTVQLSLRYSF